MISGKSNEKFKNLKKLNKKKYRNKEGLFLIETEKLVKEAIKSNIKVKYLILNEEYNLDNLKDFDLEYIILKNSLFNELSNLINPDGIMALCEKKEDKEITSKDIVILDRIQDPGNVGTIIRSSEAFGFDDVLLLNSADIYNYKTLRASMGSIFRLNCIEVDLDYIKKLKNKGYKIFALDMDGKSLKEYREEITNGKNALVVGNEGNGIDKKILEMSDYVLSLEMKGEVESLNAAISVSILMNNICECEDR